MSRTKEFTLPRIPDSSHRVPASVTSLNSAGASSLAALSHEQNQYSSFLGSKRQDVAPMALQDSLMFDEVFCKEGRLEEQTAPKANLPLTCQPYNSLHDPHVRHLYVRHPGFRKNLIEKELITDELRVKSTKAEVYQKIRSHELLERREHVQEKLQQREQDRLLRLTNTPKKQHLPPLMKWSLQRERQRQAVHLTCLANKAETHRKKVQEATDKALLEKELKRQKWLKHQEEDALQREKQLQAQLLHQQDLRSAMYDRRFADLPRGQQISEWYKEADTLHTRMVFMQHQQLWPTSTGQSRSSFTSRSSTPAYHQTLSLEQETERLAEELDQELPTDLQSPSSPRQLSLSPAESDKDDTASAHTAGTKSSAIAEEDTQATPKEIQASSPVQEDTPGKDKELTGKEDSPEELPPPSQLENPFQEMIVEALTSMDSDGSGWITMEDYFTALQIYMEAMGLSESDESSVREFIVQTSDKHQQAINSRPGCLSYPHTVHQVSQLLVNIANEIVQQAGDEARGIYAWCQLPSVAAPRVVWLNRANGTIQFHRPEEDQPAIRDKLFEDTMLGMFQVADKNGDGLVDRNEFLNMLQEPSVGLKLSQEQTQELWQLFTEYRLASLDFHQFVPFARLLILMIYNNQFDSEEEWIELSCSTNPRFWYSKISGHTILLPPDLLWESAEGMDDLVMARPTFSPLPSEPTPGVPAPPAPTRLGYIYSISPEPLPAITEEGSLASPRTESTGLPPI